MRVSRRVFKIESCTRMLGGVHFFVLPMLGGVAIFNLFNPSKARMLLLLMKSELALPCSVALIFFVLPMLGGVATFNFFNFSTAIVLLLFIKSEFALPCSVALVSFCASRARWRCDLQVLQPLSCANAYFVRRDKRSQLIVCAARALWLCDSQRLQRFRAHPPAYFTSIKQTPSVHMTQNIFQLNLKPCELCDVTQQRQWPHDGSL